MVVMRAAGVAFLAIVELWSPLPLMREPAFDLDNIRDCTEVVLSLTYSGASWCGSAAPDTRKQRV
jgi:hypothetical protein